MNLIGCTLPHAAAVAQRFPVVLELDSEDGLRGEGGQAGEEAQIGLCRGIIFLRTLCIYQQCDLGWGEKFLVLLLDHVKLWFATFSVKIASFPKSDACKMPFLGLWSWSWGIDGCRFALVFPIVVAHFARFSTNNLTALKLLTQELYLGGQTLITVGSPTTQRLCKVLLWLLTIVFKKYKQKGPFFLLLKQLQAHALQCSLT